jgi:hypothetical protein
VDERWANVDLNSEKRWFSEGAAEFMLQVQKVAMRRQCYILEI